MALRQLPALGDVLLGFDTHQCETVDHSEDASAYVKAPPQPERRSSCALEMLLDPGAFIVGVDTGEDFRLFNGIARSRTICPGHWNGGAAMGNRSRVVMGAAAATGAAGIRAVRRARRRARLRAVAEGIQESIMPTHTSPGVEQEPTADESHAPGHQHLGPPGQTDADAMPDRPTQRPWTKRYHGLRHPGRG